MRHGGFMRILYLISLFSFLLDIYAYHGVKTWIFGMEICSPPKNRTTQLSDVFRWSYYFIPGRHHLCHPISYPISGMGI